MMEQGPDAWEVIRQRLEAALEQGLTLRWLSDHTGLSKSALSYYVSGERIPSVHAAAKVARVVGYDLQARPLDWASDLERLARQERRTKRKS